MRFPVEMKGAFKNAIVQMKKNKKTNYSINENWEIYHTGAHFYATKKDGASTIIGNSACIRKAFRIDEQGNLLCQEIKGFYGNEKHQLFAIKLFAGDSAEAKIERETLAQLHYADELITDDGSNAVVISIFYPGYALGTQNGLTNLRIKDLNFFQQADLCFQLAKQYYELHRHPESPKLHIDVKGENTIIYQLERDSKWLARLIDFGSTKKISIKEEIGASLSGMTPYAIAPEVISEPIKSSQACWPLNQKTGFVSEKSDIFSFTAIVLSIFGATAPYQKRHADCSGFIALGVYDLDPLLQVIENKFARDGLFESSLHTYRLNYHFAGEQRCTYIKEEGLALRHDIVLKKFQEKQPCYIAYENFLLYVDGDKVYGYEKPLRGVHRGLKDIEPGYLSTEQLQRLDNLSGYRRVNNGAPLQESLQKVINNFLNFMEEPNHTIRASSEHVFNFFKTVYEMCELSAKETTTPMLLDNQLKVMLYQLDLMTQGIHLTLKPIETLELLDNFDKNFEALKENPNNPHPWLMDNLAQSLTPVSMFNERDGAAAAAAAAADLTNPSFKN